MWFVYFDESKEPNRFFVYSALIVDSEQWNDAFIAVKEFRRSINADHGIYISKELHAWKFASGKGKISFRRLSKTDRSAIYRKVLNFIAGSGFFRVISCVNREEFFAFDRIINRINRTAQMNNKLAIILSDEGQEIEFTRRIRKMRVYNPIPSNRGFWDDTGTDSRNIPISNIIEDPVFKKSHMSYFIQLVDFCAYALLRKERPIASRTVLGYHRM